MINIALALLALLATYPNLAFLAEQHYVLDVDIDVEVVTLLFDAV